MMRGIAASHTAGRDGFPSRAAAETLPPRSSVAAIRLCFSSKLQRRRRSTEVMTSTRRPFVM
jgi:hypothetical protein